MSAVTRLVQFFRNGYPQAVSPTGYLPLLALLRPRLTDGEVSALATDLAASGDALIDRVDIGTAIMRITHELPTAEDIDLIKHRLKACR